MQNQDHFRGGPRHPGGKLNEFFSWLRGLFSPKYVPQKIRYGDRGKKIDANKSDSETILNDKENGNDSIY
jgi:hypothetical protein